MFRTRCQQLFYELLVSYGSFKGEVFVRLVAVNPTNKKDDILNVFKILEKFTEANKLNLRRKEIQKVS